MLLGSNILNRLFMLEPTFNYYFGFQGCIMNLPLASRMQPTCIHLVGGNQNLVSHCSSGNCLASHLVWCSERPHSLHHRLLYVEFLLLNKTIKISLCCKGIKHSLQNTTVRGPGEQNTYNNAQRVQTQS